MKQIIMLLFVICLINPFNKTNAQCDVKIVSDSTTFCGDSIQMNATPQWVSLDINTANTLQSIFFTDENTGYVAGIVGKIFKTIDGGINWTEQTFGTNDFISDIYFIDTDIGYAVGRNGLIIKTTNGGLNWTIQTLPENFNIFTTLRSVYFINANTGYIVGDYGNILTTSDGGQNWTLQNSGISSNLWSVFFTNSTTGYAVGNLGTILKTIDRGVNWTKYSAQPDYGTPILRSVYFSDVNTGYIAGNSGTILKTNDGGNNWSIQESGTTIYIFSIHFTDNKTGYAVGGGQILKTTDGGLKWITEKFMSTSLYHIYFYKKTGYLVGHQGTILKLDQSGSYIWSPEIGLSSTIISNPIAYPKETTKYSVTYTTLNGCFAKDSLTINVDPLTVNAGDEKTIICGGTAQLGSVTTNYTGNGTLKYKWTPETGLNNDTIPNPTATVTSDITYKVTVTTPNDCTATDEVRVSVSPLTINAGNNKTIICGATAQLGSVTTNYTGNGTLKYKWTPDTGLNNDTIPNPTATVTSDITYTVTVTTPNGCSATDEMRVIVSPLTVDAGNDKTIVCDGTAQLIADSANYTGIGNLKYKWIPETGLNNDTIPNPTATVTSDITYTVTVSTPNGCSATDEVRVIVSPLTVDAGNDKTIVCGGTAQLGNVTTNYTGTGNLKYKWTPETGLNNDTIENPTATVTSDITYMVTVTTPNGCSATDEVRVIVSPFTVDAGNDKTIVCGGTAQLGSVTTNYTGSGTLKYKWSPVTGLNNDSIPNPTATVTSNITYTVTVTTPNGCTAADEINVIIIPMDKPEIGIVGVSSDNKNLIVWNKPISTGIESYFLYRETNVNDIYEKIGIIPYDSMSIHIDDQSMPDVHSNKYKLSIFDRSGLESPKSNHHKTMHLAINKGMGNAWNLNWEAYEGFVVSTYNIYRGTNSSNLTLIGSISGSNTQYNDLNAPPGDIYYQLEVISPNTINPTKIINKQRINKQENYIHEPLISYGSSKSNIATNVVSSVNEYEENNNINIYPNPVSNEFSIDSPGGSIFEIMNLTGQVVCSGDLTNNSVVKASNLSSGVYLVKIKTGKIFKFRKIIKK